MDYSISSGLITRSQILKHHFLQDISDSCHEVTVIGLEPPQTDFGEKISIILGASPPQNIGDRSCSYFGQQIGSFPVMM